MHEERKAYKCNEKLVKEQFCRARKIFWQINFEIKRNNFKKTVSECRKIIQRKKKSNEYIDLHVSLLLTDDDTIDGNLEKKIVLSATVPVVCVYIHFFFQIEF